MPAQSGLALQAIWEPLRQKYSIPKKPLITEKDYTLSEAAKSGGILATVKS